MRFSEGRSAPSLSFHVSPPIKFEKSRPGEAHMNTELKKRDLVVTRVFNAPVKQVWKAWSDPELVMRWWGPVGFTCPVAKMDFREGGTSLVCMRAAKDFLGGQDMFNMWTYEKIVPMKRFIYILRFADKDGNMMDPAKQGLPLEIPKEVRNEVTFKDLGKDKTEVTVTEYGWMVGQLMEMSKMGLEQCLDKMAALFAK
jgi:uncharacterized protein YndB with AHSA1/START domain